VWLTPRLDRRATRVGTLAKDIVQPCKRIYGSLTIDGEARVDSGVAAANEIHFIKANPNPILAADEDFAQSAPKVGVSYAQLFECIMRTGLKTVRE